MKDISTTTFRLPKVLLQNLRAYSAQESISQNEVVVQAISKFLKDQGVKVNSPPRFFRAKLKYTGRSQPIPEDDPFADQEEGYR